MRDDGTDPLPRAEGPGGGGGEPHASEVRGAHPGERKREGGREGGVQGGFEGIGWMEGESRQTDLVGEFRGVLSYLD